MPIEGDGHTLAVFVDFENVALGFKGKKGKEKKFEINKVMERLVEKGKIVVKKAYADWTRYSDYKLSLHEAGLELIEIPKRHQAGKNSADMMRDSPSMSWLNPTFETPISRSCTSRSVVTIIGSTPGPGLA